MSTMGTTMLFITSASAAGRKKSRHAQEDNKTLTLLGKLTKGIDSRMANI
jgi:hypothetical protein